jgi:hypothetical protein
MHMAEPKKTPVESETQVEIDKVKLSDGQASLEGDELSQAEQDKIAGAGQYGVGSDYN